MYPLADPATPNAPPPTDALRPPDIPMVMASPPEYDLRPLISKLFIPNEKVVVPDSSIADLVDWPPNLLGVLKVTGVVFGNLFAK
jgi:hypothetical protein